MNRIVLGGSNPNTVGMENAINILQLGIDTLLRIKGKISGIFVGAAGLDSGNNTSKIKKMLKEKYPKVKIRCENDVFNVIACGKNLDQCVAAICGTGMIVYANRNGNLKHFGGRGYLLDKGGSGFHIGRDAICATFFTAKVSLGSIAVCSTVSPERNGTALMPCGMSVIPAKAIGMTKATVEYRVCFDLLFFCI